MKEPAEDTYAWIRRVGTLASIPLLLGLAPIVGGAVGWVMDRIFGTRPLFTILVLLTGFASGVRETWILIRRVSDENHHSKC
jgi:F0F1-type ATP synthase assembly protein I